MLVRLWLVRVTNYGRLCRLYRWWLQSNRMTSAVFRATDVKLIDYIEPHWHQPGVSESCWSRRLVCPCHRHRDVVRRVLIPPYIPVQQSWPSKLISESKNQPYLQIYNNTSFTLTVNQTHYSTVYNHTLTHSNSPSLNVTPRYRSESYWYGYNSPMKLQMCKRRITESDNRSNCDLHLESNLTTMTYAEISKLYTVSCVS